MGGLELLGRAEPTASDGESSGLTSPESQPPKGLARRDTWRVLARIGLVLLVGMPGEDPLWVNSPGEPAAITRDHEGDVPPRQGCGLSSSPGGVNLEYVKGEGDIATALGLAKPSDSWPVSYLRGVKVPHL